MLRLLNYIRGSGSKWVNGYVSEKKKKPSDKKTKQQQPSQADELYKAPKLKINLQPELPLNTRYPFRCV